MDIDCSWPGSLHDAKIFANSNINQRMAENILPISYQILLPGWTKVPFFYWRSNLSINTISNERINAVSMVIG